ncbi:hypothetical protein GE253_05920 [Niveispirillum sp. SYP-B3756]|nr:hypothetical protein [Niveispirillum sp. SYP-B3756]
MEYDKLRKIWNQGKIPVALRRTGPWELLRVRIPHSELNYKWLKNGRKSSPIWIRSENYWEIPKSWFNDFVERSLEDYGQLYIIQPYREKEKCASACLHAEGHECQCSCMGQNHGTGNDGTWFEISDAFACKWGEKKYACRLMKKKYKIYCF